MKIQLSTERLILRPWCEDDAQYLFQYASDSQIGPAAGWPVHTSVENSRQIIKDVLSAPETYAVCLKTDGIPIGSVGLKTEENTDMTDRTDECELGYWIGKPFWGQGLIPEAARELLRHAFEDLNMRAVWCGYYDGNTKSRRVQDKLGFQYHHTTEGLEVTLLNEIRTGHTMLMTKEKWEEINKTIVDHIEQNLNGEIQQTAFDFVNYLQKNNVELIKDNGYWKEKIYYLCKFKEEYVCFFAIKDPDEPENEWTIWSEDSNAYEDATADECVKNAAWKHVDHCGNCGSCGGGKTKIIFGKVFDDVCGCTFRVDNANESDLPFLKKMVEFRIAEITDKTI